MERVKYLRPGIYVVWGQVNNMQGQGSREPQRIMGKNGLGNHREDLT